VSSSEIYEYAGFQYTVTHAEGHVILTPVLGQHPAASKEKHIRNATECYLDALEKS
jgi:hypothetical protein